MVVKTASNFKRLPNCKISWYYKNSVEAIRSKSYWNFNNLVAKDPVAMGLFSQKDLINALEKAQRRINKEKKDKEKLNVQNN